MVENYMSRAKETLTEEVLKDMLSKETWLTADEIENYFNVIRLNTSKKLVACLDKELMDKYKNVPEELKEKQEEPETTEEVPKDDKESEEEEKKKLENKIKLLDLELALI